MNYCHPWFVLLSDDITARYRALEGQIDGRVSDLRQALSQSQGVQENLDMLLRWLDQAERETFNLEKGTLISLQKEPLMENMEAQQVSIPTKIFCYPNLLRTRKHRKSLFPSLTSIFFILCVRGKSTNIFFIL